MHREASTMAVQDPINKLNMLGAGVTGLMGGSANAYTRIGEGQPSASPLSTALGTGLMGADIYGRIFG